MSNDGKVYVYEDLTTVRAGGAIPRVADDPDNVVGSVDEGWYTAFYQCPGQDVREKHGHDTYTNYWWVKIEFGHHQQGWVSAVRLKGGDNDKPQPGVPTRRTEFA
jgi:hypothetical protein